MKPPFHKVIACEIAFREICHAVAQSPSLVDLEWVTQGWHDTPAAGGIEIQRRIDAVPSGRYDAVLLGYGLCGHLIRGLQSRQVPLVIPRAHDCITFFLGSKERYQQRIFDRPGTYYYTSGWLECLRRRGAEGSLAQAFLPTRAGATENSSAQLAEWTARYGEEEARYLLATMDEWTRHYTHGTLIDFDFAGPLHLEQPVCAICQRQGWAFEKIPGDLGLLQRWLDGVWSVEEFLVVPPGHRVVPTHDEQVIRAELVD